MGVVRHKPGLFGADPHAKGRGRFVEVIYKVFKFYFSSCDAIDVIGKSEVRDGSSSDWNYAFVVFLDIFHDPL